MAISAAKRRSLPASKFAVPELKKYPLDTAKRVRNAPARLEQNKGELTAAQYAAAKKRIAAASKRYGIESSYEKPASDSQAARKRGLRMRIHADGGVDIRHLMSDGGMFAPGLVELADNDNAGPVWIQIAKSGSFNKGGRFELNQQVFGEIIRNFNDTANKRVPIDFEHASESPATEGEIPTRGAPAQGWITKLEMRGFGGQLWALVEWLPLAKQYIKAGQYKYFSPAIRFNARDRSTGEIIGARLTSGALTNNPFLDGMEQLAARDFGEEPLTPEEVNASEVNLRYDIETDAPRLNLDVNVLQAMEGIRDVISAILPCEHEDEDDEDEDEDELPSAPSNPLASAVAQVIQPYMSDTTPAAAKLADKEPVKLMADTILLSDHNAKVADLQLALKDVESKVEAANARANVLESELVALRDADAKRVAVEKVKRVDAAFSQYKGVQKLTDLDRELMVVLLDAKPELFEKRYPMIDAQTQLLTARVSQERPKVDLPAGVERPSLKTLTDKYMSDFKLSYEEAFTKALNEIEKK